MENKVKNPIEEKCDIKEEYYFCSWIDDESLQFFYDEFGKKAMDEIIKEYSNIVDFEIENILEEKGCGFNDWISEIKDRINDNEFQNDTNEEICKRLIDEMYNAF